MFFEKGITRPYPAPNFRLQASFSAGWLDQCDEPMGKEVDERLRGFGMSGAGGFYGIGGSKNWSPGSGTSSQTGLGIGAGVSPGEHASEDGTWGVKTRKARPKLIAVGAGVVFALSLYAVCQSADWDGKPDAEQLTRAGTQLDLPANSIGKPLKIFSKITLVGARRNVVSEPGLPAVENHFSELAAAHGWQLRSRQAANGEISLSYCAGDFSHVIAFRRRGDQTAIFAATYWESDKTSELYCRQAAAR
jgi:hypothetical protein